MDAQRGAGRVGEGEPLAAPRRPLGDRVASAILTAGGAGLLRPGPGTWGSAVGIGIHLLCARALGGPEWAALPLAALFFLATWKLGDRAVAATGVKDPQWIVSDEVCGVLVAVAGTSWSPVPLLWRALAAFLLFRVFDIWKPGPVGRLEKLPGGLGIAADDAMAGVISNALLQAGLLAHGALARGAA